MSENNKTESFDEAPSLEIDEQIIEEARQENTERASSRGRRSGSAAFLSFLALLLAGGGIAAGYYIYDKEIKPLSKLTGKLSELREFTASKQSLGDVQQQLQEIKESNQALQSNLANTGGDYQSLEASLNELRQQVSFGQRERSLAEVEYLLNIARDRLQYMHDSHTAAAALRGALKRIDAMADPSLGLLRKQIADDLQAVEAYQPVAAEQVLQNLTEVASGLQPLPEPLQTRQPEQQASKPLKEKGLKELWSSFKQSLAGRVRVVKHDEPLNALKQQGVASYKIDILNLRIEILRLALLRNDLARFKQELKSLVTWADSSLPKEQAESIASEVVALEQLQFPLLPQIQATVSGLQVQQDSEAHAIQQPDFQQQDATTEPIKNRVTSEPTPVEIEPETDVTGRADAPAEPSTNMHPQQATDEPTVSETMRQEAAPEELIKLQEMLEQIEAAGKQGVH